MAKSIGSDIHTVFAKFAASVVVVLIHIDAKLLCSVIRWILNKSFIGPPKMKLITKTPNDKFHVVSLAHGKV